MPSRFSPRSAKGAFTLIELLVSLVILLVLLLMLVSITTSTQKTWTYTVGKIEQFREAREAFESITRRLSQATLNTYWDYERDASGVPTRYIRQSELRFISGPTSDLGISGDRPTHGIFFQAPLGYVDNKTSYDGLDNLLNTWGYCIEFGDDNASIPPFLAGIPNPPAPQYRFRLMEMSESSEKLSIYGHEATANSSPQTADGNSKYKEKTWFDVSLGAPGAAGRPVRVLANNILALILLPKLTKEDQDRKNGSSDNSDSANALLAPGYLYDSTVETADKDLNPKNQLPPVVRVTMVAVDETSYARFQGTSTAMPGALGLEGLFSDPSKYTADMTTLENNLRTNKLNYRIFTTNISLKGAKWSREQIKQ